VDLEFLGEQGLGLASTALCQADTMAKMTGLLAGHHAQVDNVITRPEGQAALSIFSCRNAGKIAKANGCSRPGF
jgi:hypothetical protein